MNPGRRETVTVLGDQVLVSASNFLTGLLLARYLGPEGYGQYVLAMGTMLFLTSIQTALVFAPMMVKGPARPDGASDGYYRGLHRSQTLFAVAAASITLLIGTLLLLAFPQWKIESLLLPLTGVAFFGGMQEFARRRFLAQGRADAALATDLTCHGLRLSILWCASGSVTTDTALWIIAGASAASLAASAFIRTPASHTVITDIGCIAEEHWAFGKWLLAGSLAYWCGTQCTLYLAAAFLSVGTVGGMSAALSVTGAANIVFLGMENMIPQRAAAFYRSGGPAALHRYLNRVALLGGLALASLMIVAGWWNDYWITALYGVSYREYGWLVWWWGLYHMLGFVQRPYSIGLRVLDDTKALFRSTLGGAIAAALVSFPAIEMYGAPGAMLAVCVVQAVSLMLVLLSYWSGRGEVDSPAPVGLQPSLIRSSHAC